MTVRVTFMLTTQSIVDEISDHHFHQRDIAKTYRIAIRQGSDVDWPVVNGAIIDRWSISGLLRIKDAAWSGRWRGSALFVDLGDGVET